MALVSRLQPPWQFERLTGRDTRETPGTNLFRPFKLQLGLKVHQTVKTGIG